MAAAKEDKDSSASKAVAAAPSSNVTGAVALGWQVAELFHSSVHQGPASDPERKERLPGRSKFPQVTQSLWLGEQIAAQASSLLPDLKSNTVLDTALTNMVTFLKTPARTEDITLDAIFLVHCRLLEALSIEDFRLGKAYEVGRALAETAIVPAKAIPDDRAQALKELFELGRKITINAWLYDLKSLLPAHVAYAVTESFSQWETWVNKPVESRDWGKALGPLRAQGRIWRELLTGEKVAIDTLNLRSYIQAARQVAARVRHSLRPYFGWIVGGVVVVVGVVVGISFLHAIPTSVRFISDLAWVAAVLGISLKGLGSLLGGALSDVEGWLWQSELDEAVANAATYLPEALKRSWIRSDSAGTLELDST